MTYIDDSKGFFHNPMQKTTAEGWVFKCSQRKLLGPHNLMQRPALIAVTRAGMIRVLSLGQDGRWQDFKTEIENISSPFEILTHAAICPEKIADKSTTEHGGLTLFPSTGKADKFKIAQYSWQLMIITRSSEYIVSKSILNAQGSIFII